MVNAQGTTTFSVRLGHLGGEEAAKWGEYTDIAKRHTVDALGVGSWVCTLEASASLRSRA